MDKPLREILCHVLYIIRVRSTPLSLMSWHAIRGLVAVRRQPPFSFPRSVPQLGERKTEHVGV